MARCIPEAVHESQRLRGEADFLRRLREELPADWIVLHSLNLGAAERAAELEADFVLLHPRGRITLELKGGTILCEAGVWFSRNPAGRFRIKPPFHQAKTNAHEVHEHLKRRFGKDSPEATAPYTHAVVFPDCDFGAPTIEAPRDRTLDRAALRAPLGEVIPPLLALAEAQLVARKPGSAVPPPLDPARLAATVEVLRPDLRLVPNLTGGEFDAHLARLSAEQLAVFQLIEGNPRLRVTGGAGTGKTLVALEACRRARAAEPRARIGLVCFNRLLGQHLAGQVEREGLAESIEAGSLFLHIDQLLGVEPLPAGSPHAAYAERAARAAAAAAALGDEARFDLLVVDEGQDLRATPEHLRILDGLLRGGFAGGRWRWFEDAGQALVYTPSPPAPDPAAQAVEAALAAAAHVHLRRNWRNTDNVADAFARVARLPREPASGFPGPSPSLAPAPAGREAEALDILLARHVLARHDPREVVVVSLRGAGRECYAGRETLGGLRRVDFNPLAAPAAGEIRTATVARFKGLESHVVVLVDIDRLAQERDRRALYVGMSRAKYGLYLLAAPDALSAIEAELG